MTQSLLDTLLPQWRHQLTEWSRTGALTRAASEAFQLAGVPDRLEKLVECWASGDFRDLPPVVPLPASAMPTAAGAYASANGTIYLNGDWLRSADPRQSLTVLTEELWQPNSSRA